MPLYSYRCTACDHGFETLVMGGEQPTCPSCGGSALERLLSLPHAPNDRIGQIKTLARKQAGREGHLCNFSKSDLKR